MRKSKSVSMFCKELGKECEEMKEWEQAVGITLRKKLYSTQHHRALSGYIPQFHLTVVVVVVFPLTSKIAKNSRSDQGFSCDRLL